MPTVTVNAAVTTGYRQRCHHHPLPPATILPFFPSLWHGGVDNLPATLFPTFSAILSRLGEKIARSGRERRVGGGSLERGMAKHIRFVDEGELLSLFQDLGSIDFVRTAAAVTGGGGAVIGGYSS
ncbi:hypothetical protein Scep_010646 [Stephania cephalantha]|uniref:Uncharacterized protein n=1 Tax=Stephania cephalantha TaxID=152367 RepID=A0AAP0PH88_9MAGN